MRKVAEVIGEILAGIGTFGCMAASCLWQIGGVVATILGILFVIGLIRSC